MPFRIKKLKSPLKSNSAVKKTFVPRSPKSCSDSHLFAQQFAAPHIVCSRSSRWHATLWVRDVAAPCCTCRTCCDQAQLMGACVDDIAGTGGVPANGRGCQCQQMGAFGSIAGTGGVPAAQGACCGGTCRPGGACCKIDGIASVAASAPKLRMEAGDGVEVFHCSITRLWCRKGVFSEDVPPWTGALESEDA